MTEKRFYATGKRKSAIARIYMKEGTGVLQVNKRNFDDYFTRESLKMLIQQPLEMTGKKGLFDFHISVGGGGIPVVEGADGGLVGVEAVIDKDFASSLLATSLNADLLLISTAVEKVALNFNTPEEEWLDRMTLAEAGEYLEQGHFGKGSMEPKIRAIIGFLERGGKQALITDPENIERALKGETGTLIVP